MPQDTNASNLVENPGYVPHSHDVMLASQDLLVFIIQAFCQKGLSCLIPHATSQSQHSQFLHYEKTPGLKTDYDLSSFSSQGANKLINRCHHFLKLFRVQRNVFLSREKNNPATNLHPLDECFPFIVSQLSHHGRLLALLSSLLLAPAQVTLRLCRLSSSQSSECEALNLRAEILYFHAVAAQGMKSGRVDEGIVLLCIKESVSVSKCCLCSCGID